MSILIHFVGKKHNLEHDILWPGSSIALKFPAHALLHICPFVVCGKLVSRWQRRFLESIKAYGELADLVFTFVETSTLEYKDRGGTHLDIHTGTRIQYIYIVQSVNQRRLVIFFLQVNYSDIPLKHWNILNISTYTDIIRICTVSQWWKC